MNGAYFSEAPDEIVNLLLASRNISKSNNLSKVEESSPIDDVETSTTEIIIKGRIGHHNFSKNVKQNYSYMCCFPGCKISELEFIVGAHICRWADNEEMRGQISNGLCLCLMHDKAFENGYFTIDDSYNIKLNRDKVNQSNWAKVNLLQHNNKQIKLGQIKPSVKALKIHRQRIKKNSANKV